MKKFSMFFGKLPLCGKYIIRDSITLVLNSKDKMARLNSFTLYLVLMVLYITAHAEQICLGYELFSVSTRIVPAIVGACYAFINLGVCIEQSYLVWRITVFVIRHRGIYCSSEHNHSLNHDSLSRRAITVIITLLGQILFLAFYLNR